MTTPDQQTQSEPLLVARAHWHLEIGYEPYPLEIEALPMMYLDDFDDFGDEDAARCFDCGRLPDGCECHAGEDCGRWRNGRLSGHCMKAGSEECDFECPYRNTLRF